jgi:twinkle protein
MRIKSTNGKVHDLTITRSGENRQPCPECSDDRKKKSAKPFSFNLQKGKGHCMHCDATFFPFTEPVDKKEYAVPQWKNRTALTDKAASWMRGRMILDDTLNAMNVSSAVEWMPQISGQASVVCFPYYRDGRLVNVKYRDGAKNFKMEKGAELIFYNLDGVKNSKECIIVEGEIDALSFVQSGIKNVISVPNGAGSRELGYIDNCFAELQHVERFYIGVDNDDAGIVLRDELIRRFGAERCAVIDYKDCKDANEYLQRYGGFELCGLVKAAVDVKIEGVFACSDVYESVYDLYVNGFKKGAGIGIPLLDDVVSWVTGRLAVVTGIPGHGKSEIVDFIISRLNIIHGWKAAYFSPENHPIAYHFGKIASKISGKSFDSKYLTDMEFKRVFEYMDDNYYFIAPEEDVTIDSILEKAKYEVRKHGIKVLVIDPFNKLDHLFDKSETETQYISRFLDRLSNFARINGVLVFLVAHPRKMTNRKDNPALFEVPTLYDISGSANFYNKADYGLTVYRNRVENTVSIHVQKVKFKHWGAGGSVDFEYNAVNGRIHEKGFSADFDNYLSMDWNQPIQQVIKYDDEEVPF